jgi:hypothetical protein
MRELKSINMKTPDLLVVVLLGIACRFDGGELYCGTILSAIPFQQEPFLIDDKNSNGGEKKITDRSANATIIYY